MKSGTEQVSVPNSNGKALVEQPTVQLEDAQGTRGVKRRSNDRDAVPVDQRANVKRIRLEKNMPVELLTEVASQLTSDDPSETYEDLANFGLTAKTFDGIVSIDRFKTHMSRIKRLGTLARRLHDAVIPKERFAEQAAGGPNFVSAATRIRAIAPMQKFQSPAQRSLLAGHIFTMEKGSEQAGAISAIAPHLSTFNTSDRTEFGRRLLDYFVEDGNLESATRDIAAKALRRAYPNLENKDKLRLLDALQKPELGIYYSEAAVREANDREEEEVARELTKFSEGDDNAVHQRPGLDTRIEEIELSGNSILAAPNNGIDRMPSIAELSNSLDEAFGNARADLVNRTRDRSGYSR